MFKGVDDLRHAIVGLWSVEVGGLRAGFPKFVDVRDGD